MVMLLLRRPLLTQADNHIGDKGCKNLSKVKWEKLMKIDLGSGADN
jgi:competence protein ComGC